eukprot:1765900-Alexandrium_andersonii.AAC.1
MLGDFHRPILKVELTTPPPELQPIPPAGEHSRLLLCFGHDEREAATSEHSRPPWKWLRAALGANGRCSWKHALSTIGLQWPRIAPKASKRHRAALGGSMVVAPADTLD